MELQNVSKSFSGLKVLDDVGFAIGANQVTTLIGPNGAGKSTLFNIIAGALKPDDGHIAFNGHDITGLRSDRILRLGLVRTFQGPRLFEHLSVLENVMIGRNSRTKTTLAESIVALPRAVRERRTDIATSYRWLDSLGLADAAMRRPTDLPYADQRRLEMARALAAEPTLLLLDEPGAGMTYAETEALLRLIRQLSASGLTIFLIEHDMNFVMTISDRIHVLDHGKLIASGAPSEIKEDPAVVRAYLGDEHA